jgi:DUF1680 family protein
MVRDGVQAPDPFKLNGMWVPWYTQHKVLAGLIDAAELCEIEQARQVAVGFADWCQRIVGPLSDEQIQEMLKVEHGGMAESLARLAAITGESRYLKLAMRFRHAAVFDPAAAGTDALDHIHANTQIPKFIGYETIYEQTGESRWHDAARNFWRFVARDRSFIIGGNSTREHFFPVGQFGEHVLEFQGPETCNTYNMLRLTERLFCNEPSAPLADFYERAIYNHILASQLPHTPGAFTYFTTMRPGGFRGYSKPFNDFWCCVGTGMENHARYGRFIYAHTGSSTLIVNLFISSELTWGDVIVRQEMTFPFEPRTRISLEMKTPRQFKLAVRVPSWIEPSKWQPSLNGTPLAVRINDDGYAEIDRLWNGGDTVTIELPMRLRTEPLPHAPHYVAILYGPIVLAGEFGRDGVSDDDFRAHIVKPVKGLPLADTATIIDTVADEICRHIEPIVDRPLHFRMTGVTRPMGDFVLLPFFALHQQRYQVYWPLMSGAQYVAHAAEVRELEKALQLLQARTVDQVSPGQQQPEVDHGVQSDRSTTGTFNDRSYREARDGGYFSYRVKVVPDQPMTLRCSYWGCETSPRRFDILIDGQLIATQLLRDDQPGKFFDVDYAIPPDLTSEKSEVTVRFQSIPGTTAGGLYHVAMLKPSN